MIGNKMVMVTRLVPVKKKNAQGQKFKFISQPPWHLLDSSRLRKEWYIRTKGNWNKDDFLSLYIIHNYYLIVLRKIKVPVLKYKKNENEKPDWYAYEKRTSLWYE